jgi:GT2 family glycosyltransferase
VRWRAGQPLAVNQPLVSICIPTFNRPELLARAVHSCLGQTYRNFEIVITDNSDGDASRDFIARLNEPRVRYHKNDENIGGYKNLLKVMSLARGTYLSLLMDDDLLKPRALELMVEAFEQHPTAGVVMAPMAMIDEEDRRIFPYFYIFRKMHYRYRFQVGDGLVERRKVLKTFLVDDYPCCVPSGVMYRAAALQKVGTLDPKCGFAVDLDLSMRIAVHYDFYYIDQVLSSWRFMPANETAISHQKGFNIASFYYITRKILADENAMNLFPRSEWPRLKRQSIYFCSCRALLNLLAGIHARSWSIIADVFRVIWREDPYLANKLKLPWFIVRQIFISFIPPGKPLPKE